MEKINTSVFDELYYLPNDITIVMTTYNRMNVLKENILNVLSSKYFFELLILDDDSSDDTENIVNEINDVRLKYFSNDKNMGYAYSLNRGIRLAKYDLIFLCEDDAFILNIDKFFTILNAEMKDNLIIATHIVPKSKNFFRIFFIHLKKHIAQVLVNDDHRYNGKKRKYISFGNNCFAFNKSFINTRFDEIKFKKNTHRIESDFQIRARRSGAKILYNPDLKIDHKHIISGGIPSRNMYMFMMNHIIFLQDYYSRWKIYVYIFLKLLVNPMYFCTIRKVLRSYSLISKWR